MKGFYEEVSFHLDFLQKKWDENSLEKIHFDKLKVLTNDVVNYRPKSKIKNEEELIIAYLRRLIQMNESELDKNEIFILEHKYIFPILTKFHSKGYLKKNSWLFALLFLIPIDLVLIFIGIGKFYFYIPVIALAFSFFEVRREHYAYKNDKLW